MAPLAPSSRLIIPSPGPATAWHLLPISSSSRRALTGRSHDDLRLLHWVKDVNANAADYRFARFHKAIRVRGWAEAEYERWLQAPDWTRDETDVLMRLCRQYDLSFVVVHDRFNTEMQERRAEGQSGQTAEAGQEAAAAAAPQWRERSVEELKGRYYGIQVRLLQLHNASDPELRKHPLLTSSYDEEYERRRKQLLQAALRRRQRDVEDMGQAVIEHRRVLQQIRKIKRAAKEQRDRDSGRGAAGPASAAAASSPALSASHKKSRSKDRHLSSSSSSSLLSSISEAQLAPVPDDLLPSLPPLTSPTPFLRSSQLSHCLSSLSPRLLRHVEAELTAMGVKRVKEIIPTGPVLELMEKVRAELLLLRALEQLNEQREAVRDELREEERRKGGAARSDGGGGGGSRAGEAAAGAGGGGEGGGLGLDGGRPFKKERKEKRSKAERATDREEAVQPLPAAGTAGAGGGGSGGTGGGGEPERERSSGHKKKESKRKGGGGEQDADRDRDANKRRKK